MTNTNQAKDFWKYNQAKQKQTQFCQLSPLLLLALLLLFADLFLGAKL